MKWLLTFVFMVAIAAMAYAQTGETVVTKNTGGGLTALPDTARFDQVMNSGGQPYDINPLRYTIDGKELARQSAYEIGQYSQAVAGTEFYDERVDYIKTARLSGDRIFAMFDDTDDCFFTILDKDGSTVKTETLFNTTGFGGFTNGILALSNGNVLLWYSDDGNSDAATFKIYDADGNQVVDEVVFSSLNATMISAVETKSGNIFFTWSTAGPLVFYAIYSTDGTAIVSATEMGLAYGSTGVPNTIPFVLDNGNIAVAYNYTTSGLPSVWRIYAVEITEGGKVGTPVLIADDDRNAYIGYQGNAIRLTDGSIFWQTGQSTLEGQYFITTQDFDVLVDVTDYRGYDVISPEAFLKPDGNVLISYCNAGARPAIFLNYYPANDSVGEQVTYSATNIYHSACEILSDGTLFFMYENDDVGEYQLWQPAGPRFVDGATFVGTLHTGEIVYDSTFWDDLSIPTIGAAGGAAAPDLETFVGGGIKAYSFAGGVDNETIYGEGQFSHTVKDSSIVYPHFHLAPSTAPASTDTVVLELEYTWQYYGGVFAAPDTITTKIPMGDYSQWQHVIVDAAETIPAIGNQASSIINVRLTRLQNNASDTYSDDVFIFTLDLHYEIDKAGSASETPY